MARFPGAEVKLEFIDPAAEDGESGAGATFPTGREIDLPRPRLADYLADGATVRRRADAIFAALADGSLRLDISGRYTLDQVEIAHVELEDRRQLGKSVLLIILSLPPPPLPPLPPARLADRLAPPSGHGRLAQR